MKAMITVGLGFGDEGKGATVDYLARVGNADLVVRYSGGAQAGHNVQLEDGRRHTFAQFGAATFSGVPTWLGPRVIINPELMIPEAEHLKSLGVPNPFSLLSVHPDCIVTTSMHALMNQLREISRGNGKHGSCGIGIGESRSYWLRYGHDAIVAADLDDREGLIRKLTLLRDRLLMDMQELSYIVTDLANRLHRIIPAREADAMMDAAQNLRMERIPTGFEWVVFEGAQGVLLDEWFGFHPHTTWSTVTHRHAIELTHEMGIDDVKILGITRAYSTRHGAGPFPTQCPEMTKRILDPGNPENRWQDSIRCGPLDLVLLQYAARVCEIDSLVVNCLDQLPEQTSVCCEYEGLQEPCLPHRLTEQEELTRMIQTAKPVLTQISKHELLGLIAQIAPIEIESSGPSWQDRIRNVGAARNNMSGKHLLKA